MDLAEKIRMLIDRSGMSGAEIARRAGIKQPRLSEWQNPAKKRKPTLAQAWALARALGIPLDYLADDERDEPPAMRGADEEWVLSAARSLGMDRAKKRLLGLPDSAPAPTGIYLEGLAPEEPPRPARPARKRGSNAAG